MTKASAAFRPLHHTASALVIRGSRGPNPAPRGVERMRAIATIQLAAFIAMVGILACPVRPVRAGDPVGPTQPSDLVLVEELRRIEVIERVSPSVVCMYDQIKHGGGSGVIISPEGNGLTNYHVVAGMLDDRRGYGGLGDGVLYEMEVLGVDPTGDVAMFRLEGPGRLPYAPLGDSGRAALGDAVIVMGNPFVMSEDYSPSVTMGIVTGLHRYQWGVKGNLTYSDCIQTDASINPGNSGGPLFNMQGEIIGINGRISVNTRGRYNVGFGYAISSNQIRRFVPALRAGLLARHGDLLATVVTGGDGSLLFDRIASDSPLGEAGVKKDDRLLAFDGVRLTSANHYVSLIGTYPEDWPVPLDLQRGDRRWTEIVRLAPVEPNMKTGFEVKREVNLREVQRVLEAHRKAVLADDDAAAPKKLGWKITREFPDDPQAPPQTFSAADAADAVRFTRQHDDGSAGATITYNQSSASRLENDGDPADLPVEIGMAYQALFVLQRVMTKPAESMDLDKVAITGADFGSGRVDLEMSSASDAWEVLEWPVAEHLLARYSFDPRTGRCTRIRVKDIPSGAQAVIELTDYKDVGGGFRPCGMDLIGPTYRFRDRLSDWGPV